MINLIMDVKIYVASQHEKAWTRMVFFDEEFKIFAHTNEGIRQFIKQFTVIQDQRTYLLGYIHSVDDTPSLVTNDITRWTCKGISHRANDLPAVIYKNGHNYWYNNGKMYKHIYH